MAHSEPGGGSATATAPPPVEEEHRESLGRRIQHLLHAHSILGPLAVLIVSIIVFSILSERFLLPSNISLVLQQVTVVAILGIGQTIIILTAGIDLSNGAIMVLSSIVMAKLSAEAGLPGTLALLLGFVVGTLCGLVNGLLVTRLRLPPFIVTLGTLFIFFSLNLYVSGSATIRGRDMAPLLLWTGNTFTVGGARITYGSILMLILFGIFAYALQQTAGGQHEYATGDDSEAARLAGSRIDRVLLSVYCTAGFMYAIAAWTLIGRIAAASPQAGQNDNLNSITAVVLGGTSLFGGRGTVIGTLIGALIVGVFRNGLVLVGVQDLWQDFAVGVLVIAAVSIDQWIRKVKA